MKTLLALVLWLLPVCLSADDDRLKNAESLDAAIKSASAEAAKEGKSYYLVVVYVSDLPMANHTTNAVYAWWHERVYESTTFRLELKGPLLARLIGFPLRAMPPQLTGIPTFFAGTAGSDSIHQLPPPALAISGEPAKFLAYVAKELSTADPTFKLKPQTGPPNSDKDGPHRFAVIDKRVTVKANSADAYKLGVVRKGDLITLQYVEGKWKDHGHIPTANPDNPDDEEVNRLVIAMPSRNGVPGEAVAVVPAGTAAKPFSYIVPTTDGDLVLRINAHSDNSKNPGEVSYRLQISR